MSQRTDVHVIVWWLGHLGEEHLVNRRGAAGAVFVLGVSPMPQSSPVTICNTCIWCHWRGPPSLPIYWNHVPFTWIFNMLLYTPTDACAREFLVSHIHLAFILLSLFGLYRSEFEGNWEPVFLFYTGEYGGPETLSIQPRSQLFILRVKNRN